MTHHRKFGKSLSERRRINRKEEDEANRERWDRKKSSTGSAEREIASMRHLHGEDLRKAQGEFRDHQRVRSASGLGAEIRHDSFVLDGDRIVCLIIAGIFAIWTIVLFITDGSFGCTAIIAVVFGLLAVAED